MAIKITGNGHLQIGHVVHCAEKFPVEFWFGNGRMILVSYTHIGLKTAAPV